MYPGNNHCLVAILKNLGTNPIKGDQGSLQLNFFIFKVKIHPRQSYRGGGDAAPFCKKNCPFHPRYGRLVGPGGITSLKYGHRLWKFRYLPHITI